MSYAKRVRASARRIARHFQGLTATLVDRQPGALDTGDLTLGTGTETSYTVLDSMILTAEEFFSRTGLSAVGELIVSVPRDAAAWSASQATPDENWQVTIDGRTGTVKKVHTKVPVWILECSES